MRVTKDKMVNAIAKLNLRTMLVEQSANDDNIIQAEFQLDKYSIGLLLFFILQVCFAVSAYIYVQWQVTQTEK